MDDLISRQLVMKTLCERRCGDKPKGCPSGFCTESLAVDCIPSAKPAQQWIPCSERLPEKNGRYLATRGLKACNSIWNRVYIINYSDLMGLKAEKIWWDGNVGKSDFQRIDDVVAWMPRPKPYKGEES